MAWMSIACSAWDEDVLQYIIFITLTGNVSSWKNRYVANNNI